MPTNLKSGFIIDEFCPKVGCTGHHFSTYGIHTINISMHDPIVMRVGIYFGVTHPE